MTFVHTKYNLKRLLKSRGPDALNGRLTPMDSDGDVSQDIPSLTESITKKFLLPFCELLLNLNTLPLLVLLPQLLA